MQKEACCTKYIIVTVQNAIKRHLGTDRNKIIPLFHNQIDRKPAETAQNIEEAKDRQADVNVREDNKAKEAENLTTVRMSLVCFYKGG